VTGGFGYTLNDQGEQRLDVTGHVASAFTKFLTLEPDLQNELLVEGTEGVPAAGQSPKCCIVS